MDIEKRIKKNNIKKGGLLIVNLHFWPDRSSCSAILFHIAKELSKKMITIDFKCIDCWGVKYEPEHFTVRHSHWPATFSFAYYIKLPKDPSPIIFPTANYEYNPNVGDLVLFPGQIQHEVKPVNGERIMISGNLVVDKWK